MALASIPTVLSLDQFAAMLGMDPRHFNQVVCDAFPEAPSINSVWFQYSWQAPGRASREDLAVAISQAERMIAERTAFWPGPVYTVGERHSYPVPRTHPQRYSRAVWPRIYSDWKRVIRAGRRYVADVDSGVTVDYLDEDGDDFAEIAQIELTVAGASAWELEEVAVFLGTDTTEENRVRYLNVAIVGDDITIRGQSAQFVKPAILLDHSYAPDDGGDRGVDGDDPTNFIAEVNIYRVYTRYDTDEYAPAQLGWQTFTNATEELVTQSAAVQLLEPGRGRLSIIPATWSVDDGEWKVSTLSQCRYPDLVRLYYRSGWAADVQGNMKRDFARAVTSLAVALLVDPIGIEGRGEALVTRWREAPEDQDLIREACPFGDKRGAWEAWSFVNTFFVNLEGLSA